MDIYLSRHAMQEVVKVETEESQVALRQSGRCRLQQPNVTDSTDWVHPARQINLVPETNVDTFLLF